MPRRVPDITTIRALIGYEPTVELDETLTRVIEHFRQAKRAGMNACPSPPPSRRAPGAPRRTCFAARRSRSGGCCSRRAATARPSMPEIVQIESTNICNAKCVFCPRDDMHRRQGIMTVELFRKIVDECVELGITHVRMHNYGEAFIDKQLVDEGPLRKQKGIQEVGMISNGSLITEAGGARHDRGGARRDQHQRRRGGQRGLRVDAHRPEIRQGDRQHRAPGAHPGGKRQAPAEADPVVRPAEQLRRRTGVHRALARRSPTRSTSPICTTGPARSTPSRTSITPATARG